MEGSRQLYNMKPIGRQSHRVSCVRDVYRVCSTQEKMSGFCLGCFP